MKKQAKQGKSVVGFYKDRDGKTKPITKSAAELNRKKFIEGGHEFKPVTVVTHVRSLSQALEDLLAEVHLAEDHLAVLREQQTQLQAEGKVSAQVDAEIQKTSAQIRLLKNRIRGLHAQHI
jgi:hypothetical protein